MTELSAFDVVRHLAAWGAPAGPRRPVVVPESVWQAVPAVADFHQVTGPVLAAMRDGVSVEPPAEMIEDLVQRHLEGLRSALLTEADLVSVSRLFADRGIDHRVLKGGATAHLDHLDPALRRTSDVDLLVAPDHLGAATAAVRTLVDDDRTVPDRSAAWTERYGKDRTLALLGGGWLDLHRALVPGYHAVVDRHDWFADAEPFTVAGTELLAPRREDRFVHAVAHAGFADHRRLHSMRDIPWLIGAIVDWRGALDRHPEWRGLLARGVLTAWSTLGLEQHPIVEWARLTTPTRREQLALRTYELQGSRQHWGAALAVGPHRWPGLIGPLVLPSRAYLDHHGRSLSGHVRSTVRRVGPSSRR